MSGHRVITGGFFTQLPGEFVTDTPAAESTPAPAPQPPGRGQQARTVARVAFKASVLVVLGLGYVLGLLWWIATLDRRSVRGQIVIFVLKAAAVCWLIRIAASIAADIYATGGAK